jgi:hypothetical protein
VHAIRIGRDFGRRERVDALAEIAAAVEVNAGRVQLARAVPAEIAGGGNMIAGRERLGCPVLPAVRWQIAGRVQRPLLAAAVVECDLDVVTDMRIGPPDPGDDAVDLALEFAVELGRERVMGVAGRCERRQQAGAGDQRADCDRA